MMGKGDRETTRSFNHKVTKARNGFVLDPHPQSPTACCATFSDERTSPLIASGVLRDPLR